MWSLTGVNQPVVGERWWRVDGPTADQRDPFPGSHAGAAAGRLIDRTTNRLPRPLLGFLGALLPAGRAHGLRTSLVRAAGHHRVDPSATFVDLPTITSTDPTGPTGDWLTVGAGSFVNARCSFDLGAAITVGDHVYLADRVQLLTSSGGVAGLPGRAPAPISIGAAAWLGAGAIVGPGVRVGAGAIVAAGSVVDRDVPAHTMVAGAPAVVVKRLPVC